MAYETVYGMVRKGNRTLAQLFIFILSHSAAKRLHNCLPNCIIMAALHLYLKAAKKIKNQQSPN